jgi:hypothetical protein
MSEHFKKPTVKSYKGTISKVHQLQSNKSVHLIDLKVPVVKIKVYLFPE